MAAYLEAFPGDFDSAILSSPFLGHRAGGVAFVLLGLLDLFGGRSYVPGGGPFRFTAFEQNKETHSMARHDRKFQDYADHPEIRMGNPTVHWMMETRRMMRSIQAGAGAVACQALVFQAGEDAWVDGRATEEFCERVRDCRRVFIAEARHELLIEADAIRDRVLAEIRAFIMSRSGAGGG
jgi:lysophospholipase